MNDAAARRFPVALAEAHIRGIENGLLGKQTLAWMMGVSADDIEIDGPIAPTPMSASVLADALGL